MTTPRTSGGREAAAGQPPFDLARLIHPRKEAEFLAGYWEKKPLIIHRDDPEYYSGLLTLADMDTILSTSGIRSSELRIVSDGNEIPLSQVVSGQPGGQAAALEGLYETYRKGATINLTFLHERYAPLTSLCRSLAGQLSCGFQTNVYLTPGGRARGLTPHYDTHDVFVVQAYGSKHWRLYESPIHLPLPTQPSQKGKDGFGVPVAEFDLQSGDMLYLPRGTVHEAVSNDCASLHLTIGIMPIVWAQVVRESLEHVISNDTRFREALPLGFAWDTGAQRRAGERLDELIGSLRDAVSTQQQIGLAAKRAMVARQPGLGGHLLDLERLERIEVSTRVGRRPDLQWRLTGDGGTANLEFHGKSVTLPADFMDELRFVAAADSFTGRDIPGPLDDPGRVTLVRTLVREGFCTLG
jgi:hypothetical protein